MVSLNSDRMAILSEFTGPCNLSVVIARENINAGQAIVILPLDSLL
jgi:hypothetical protein